MAAGDRTISGRLGLGGSTSTVPVAFAGSLLWTSAVGSPRSVVRAVAGVVTAVVLPLAFRLGLVEAASLGNRARRADRRHRRAAAGHGDAVEDEGATEAPDAGRADRGPVADAERAILVLADG